MNLHFLSASVPLTKTYTRQDDGTIRKSSYPDVYRVTSHCEPVDTLAQFHACLERHAKAGHCLLKGELTHALSDQSRAGATVGSAATEWICLDIDGLNTSCTIEQILAQLGIFETSYILQWSNSHGIYNPHPRCHIFMLLDTPAPAPALKQWLKHLNLTVPLLAGNLRLTRTGNALRWPLDISTCQSDKLIFIAPPLLNQVRDPLRKRPRIELVERARARLTLPAHLATAAADQPLEIQRKNTLREAAGLPVKKTVYRVVKDTEVLGKPDRAVVTIARVGEQFTYLNLNGGDSAAYFHPNGNPEFIYNFKGEPNYLTRELDPDYWKQARLALEQAKSQAREQQQRQRQAVEQGAFSAGAAGTILLAFRDRKSGVYYHGSYHQASEQLDLSVARSERQIADFCAQYNMPQGDYIPIWDITFDPFDTVRVDPQNRLINAFERTRYMRESRRKVERCPPTIFKLIHHFLGGEDRIIGHFINWLAFIVQRRTATGTAWVLYGTEGTGKGMFMKTVLRPLLGEHQSATLNASVLTEKYNAYLKDKLLVFYDEAHITEMRGSEGIMARLRSAITEPILTLRAMYANVVEVLNYSNYILASNKPGVILLQPGDRRWNIGRYQHARLALSEREYATLQQGSQLQAFYDYLYHYRLDEAAARTPLLTEDRQQLIDTTLSSADEVAAALNSRAASMEFLLDQLPTDNGYMANAARINRVEDYRAVLRTLLGRTTSGGACKISRDELYTIFEYTVGGMPDTPNKFTKFLAHRHIRTRRIRLERLVYGIQVTWRDAAGFPRYLAEHFPTPDKRRSPA